MPADMLVKLYNLKDRPELCQALERQGIRLGRAMPADRARVVQFVKNNFGDVWARECAYTFTAHPVSCFAAVRERKVIGFACYDAAAKGMLGPMGVYGGSRGEGVGEALLHACLLAMRNDGYAYAVVGPVDEAAAPFYEKTAGASAIADSFPGGRRGVTENGTQIQ